MRKRILSIVLSIVMLVSLLPTAAFAAGTDTGKAIQLVDSGTAANIGGRQADSIYFGTYKQSSDGNSGYNVDPIKWRVLSNADGKLFLLSDQNLDVFEYHKEYESVTWETSTMRSWLNGLAVNQGNGDNAIDYADNNFLDTAFSTKEQTAIAETAVVNDDNGSVDGGNDTTDKVFLLSIAEAENTSYFADDNSRIATNTAYVAGGGEIDTIGMNSVGAADYWWLRSPGCHDYCAARVNSGGVYSYAFVNKAIHAVRPAFNLNLESVLFTSAAAGGKADSTVDGSLSAVGAAGSEWKLTLLDSSRGFSVTENSFTGAPGDAVSITYSGAKTGNNEYVSVMLAQGDTILYYGRIAQNSASGTAGVTIPSGLADGTYTLKVFSEQYNGDQRTDYASAFEDISLTVSNNPTETHSHPICGATCTHDTDAAQEGTQPHSTVTYTAWDGTGTPNGSVYLTNDVNKAITISSGEVNLCLNGHSITSNGENTITVSEGATLNICDCQTTAGSISATGDRGNGISNSGTVNIYGGSVEGDTYGIQNNAGTVNIYGGSVDEGIYNGGTGSVIVSGGSVSGTYGIQNGTGSVKVTGGSVSGTYGIQNESGGSVEVSGGSVSSASGNGVNNYNGSVTVSGGSVTGKENGIDNSNATATVSGGTVTGSNGYGIKNSSGGTLNLSGAPTITGATADVYLSNINNNTSFITITGKLTYTVGNAISVKMYAPGTFTSGWASEMGDAAATYDSYFTSANNGYTVQPDGSELKLAKSTDFTVTVNLTKDGEAWADSGKTIALYQSGAKKYDLTGSNGVYTASNVAPGTYDVYVDGADTNVDVSSANAVTVEYFTVTYDKGSSTGGTVPAPAIVLKGELYTFDTTLPLTLAGYEHYAWSKDGAEVFHGYTYGYNLNTTITGTKTLYPGWRIKKPNATASATYNGTAVENNTAVFAQGGDLVLTASVNHGDTNATYEYAWYNGENLIAGATAQTYTIEDAVAATYSTYKCTVTVTGSKGGSYTTDATFNITINEPIQITGSVSISGTAKYGETLTATYTGGETVSNQWVRVDGNTETPLTADTGSNGTKYTLTAADIGKTIKVKVTGTGNYSGTVESAATTAVSKATPTHTAPTAKTGLVYTGETQSLVNAGTATGGTMQYNLGGNNNPTGTWRTDIPTGTEVKTYYVWYKVVGDPGYEDVEQAYVAVTIGKAPAATTPDSSSYTIDYADEKITVNSGYEMNTTNDGTGTAVSNGSAVTPGTTIYIRKAADTNHVASDWTAVTIPARPAAPTDLLGVNETVDGRSDGKITGTTTAMEYSTDGINWTTCGAGMTTGRADGTYQVRYKAVTEGENKAFASPSVSVTIATGAAPTYTLNVTALTFDDVTFGYTRPEAKALTISSTGNSDATISSVTVSSSDFEIGGSGDTVTALGSIDTWTVQPKAALAAGTYTATVTVTYNGGATATAEVSIVVNKAEQAAPAAAPEVESKTYTSVTLKAVGPNGNGAVAQYSMDGGSTWQDSPEFTGLTAGTQYSFVVRYKTVDSYADSPAGPALSVSTNAYSSGGDYTPTYAVTIEKGENGEITANRSHVSGGSTVTITVTPKDGYVVDAVTVTDSQGNRIEVTRKNNGTYTFKMPGRKVTIEAVFVPENSFAACTGDSSCPMYGYTDLDTKAWYHDGVHYCIENGLMTGYGNGIFKPNTDTSRAMIAVMLWRLEGSPVVNYLLDFEDVQAEVWYTEAVRWAKSEGIVSGYGNGYLGTNDSITREQMVTILWRYAQYKGIDVSVGEDTNILSYNDAFDVAEYAIPAMQWACGSGMVQGKNDPNGGMILDPESKATRAQIATMMMRFCENIME